MGKELSEWKTEATAEQFPELRGIDQAPRTSANATLAP